MAEITEWYEQVSPSKQHHNAKFVNSEIHFVQENGNVFRTRPDQYDDFGPRSGQRVCCWSVRMAVMQAIEWLRENLIHSDIPSCEEKQTNKLRS